MDWKKLKARLWLAHWYSQKYICIGIIILSGIFSILFMIPTWGDDDVIPDNHALLRWFAKIVLAFAVMVIATWSYWHVMKKRYPDYPNHNRDKDFY